MGFIGINQLAIAQQAEEIAIPNKNTEKSRKKIVLSFFHEKNTPKAETKRKIAIKLREIILIDIKNYLLWALEAKMSTPTVNFNFFNLSSARRTFFLMINFMIFSVIPSFSTGIKIIFD